MQGKIEPRPAAEREAQQLEITSNLAVNFYKGFENPIGDMGLCRYGETAIIRYGHRDVEACRMGRLK